jgi:hypothetical protein
VHEFFDCAWSSLYLLRAAFIFMFFPTAPSGSCIWPHIAAVVEVMHGRYYLVALMGHKLFWAVAIQNFV